MTHPGPTRRQYLAASLALAATAFAPRAAFAQTVIRQGYQTNLWGMPTYYLLRSGLLEKRGLKFEEFGVPSGNLTMQQMVARQVDLGTYAGPSLILGHDKGGLVAIAQIEHVGKTASVMVRKDLNLTKIEQLKGLKIANQTGSSVGNIFVDQIAPKHGLKKGDYQEVRMDVNNMITAMSAKTVDAMVNVEPYNAIAEADGLAVKIMNYYDVDKMPVFMAATPDFISKSPDAVVTYLKAWLEVAKDFKDNPTKVADAIYAFYTSKGYSMSQETFRKAMATVDVTPASRTTSSPTCRSRPRSCCGRRRSPRSRTGARRCARTSWRRRGRGRRPAIARAFWCTFALMRRNEIISALRAHEAELKQAGIASLSLIGSAARGDDQPDSDIDVVVRLTDEAQRGGFAYFGRIDRLRQRLEAILARHVDLIAEPIEKERLRREIERDRVLAF